MKRQTRYIVLLVGVVVLIVLVQVATPKPIDWTPTYYEKDTNPFGAYATDKLLDPFFGKVENNNFTLYELSDSIKPGDNIISISEQFDPDDAANEVLLSAVYHGSHAFISASFFRGQFADTLGLYTVDIFFSGLKALQGGTDSSDLKFVFRDAEKKGYYYRSDNISYYFSTLDSLKQDAAIISTNAWNKPVTLKVPFGKGYFILNTTPLAFTNNYILEKNTGVYAEQTLSYLPRARTWWTAYYQLGRLESQSPLRYVLNTEALRWAYWLMIAIFAVLLLFESKRKQRIIPIVRPLGNTTLEFVKTIANMFLHAGDHKAIAEKKIAFFLERVRSRYFITVETGDAFVDLVSRKSGYGLERTQSLFALIHVIQSSHQITDQMLMDLNSRIEDFTRSKS